MPKKAISEMSQFEQMHHSLGGKTFRAIVLFSLLISIAAIAFGYSLYVSSVRRDFRVKTWQMSKTASELLDTGEVLREAEEVVRIYDSMTEEEQAQLQDKHAELLSRFEGIRGDGFDRICETLLMVQNNNGGKAAFTAILDLRTNRRIFVTDSDPKDSFCPPGSWDELGADAVSDLVNGRQDPIDRFYGVGKIPATTINMEPYGHRCMAGTKIAEIEGYQVFVFFDTDMNLASAASSRFFRQYVLLLGAVTLLILAAAIWYMRRTTVEPINRLAEAAMAYVNDQDDTHRDAQHFAKLQINTGDEIEKLSLAMKEMEADLGNYVRNLTRVTAEKERISTELALATRIQSDMLPSIYPAFPERPEFDIYAAMRPAREVGGDFYNFFLVDEDHLCLFIADVSGKGIPAALFMMASMIILSNNAMLGKSPAQILTDTNRAICSNNREDMFVTAWLGILEISTGRLTAANAGHEYPMVKPSGGSFAMLRDKHAFVIGAVETARYEEYELSMEPGSKLFLYTDGVTEASDAEKKMFGTDRMLEALNEMPEGSPEEILQKVRDAADRFVQKEEQFDDMTMLCLEYIGTNEL